MRWLWRDYAAYASCRPDFSADAANPAMAAVTDNAQLPRVLLIGDSISVGYTLPTRELLAGVANVHRIPENGGPTTNGLAQIDAWLGKEKWDVIHFNWGLHDLKLVATNQHMVPVAEYEKNLEQLVRRLKQTKAKLVWASITPVPDGKLNPWRDADDEVEYNVAARRVMMKHNVEINYLHTFARERAKHGQIPQNVHFTPEGSKALAGQVAATIRAALAK
jgi:acyl-CoA thioesterase-1